MKTQDQNPFSKIIPNSIEIGERFGEDARMDYLMSLADELSTMCEEMYDFED